MVINVTVIGFWRSSTWVICRVSTGVLWSRILAVIHLGYMSGVYRCAMVSYFGGHPLGLYVGCLPVCYGIVFWRSSTWVICRVYTGVLWSRILAVIHLGYMSGVYRCAMVSYFGGHPFGLYVGCLPVCYGLVFFIS